MITKKECPHNHDKKFTESHDFDPSFSMKCGHGCGYSESDLVNELSDQLAKLKSKSNQRKRTVKNHKNKLSQARKLIEESISLLSKSAGMVGRDEYIKKAEMLLKTRKMKVN